MSRIDDIPFLTTGNEINISDGWIKTVQQLDYVRRQIELCRDLHLTGELLHKLNAVNTPQSQRPDFNWLDVVEVAMLGLNYQNDPARKATASNEFNEELRDALAADFMKEVVANSELLTEKIHNWEDIYKYLLLDVNVSSEVPKTRLWEASR